MPFVLSPRSLARLRGVHPDLVKVVHTALAMSDIDFAVVEGVRSVERQKQLFDAGKSQTLASRHLGGFAVDLVAIEDNKAQWDMDHARKVADAMAKAARACEVPVEWGGNWASFKDGPHFQLSKAKYPGT